MGKKHTALVVVIGVAQLDALDCCRVPAADNVETAGDVLHYVLPAMAGGLTIEVSPGELLDKITILVIKSEHIADPAKLANIRQELSGLMAVRDREVAPSDELTGLTAELKEVNEALWRIEDDVRRCDRDGDFGPRFVELARSVYRTNDRRAALKRRVNELLGARVVEEKSYADYGGGAGE